MKSADKNREIICSDYIRYLKTKSDSSSFVAARFLSPDGSEYLFANDRVLKLFNITLEKLSSYSREKLFSLLPLLSHVCATIFESEMKMLQSGSECTTKKVFADDRGYDRSVEISVVPVKTEGKIIGSITSVRETNMSGENAILREDEIFTHINQVRALKRIIEINDIVRSCEDSDVIFYAIMEKVKDIMIAEAGSLMIYDESDNSLEFTVAIGVAGDKLQKKHKIPVEKGLAGWVARNKEPLIINDPYSDERFERSFDERTGFKTKALICAPLICRGELIGVIQAINPVNRKVFTQFDLELFSVFAGLASLAVAQAMSDASIKETKENSLKLFLRLLSDREKECLIRYTEGYSRREIAKMMDVFPETCDAYFRRIHSKMGSIASDRDSFLEDVAEYLKKEQSITIS